MATLGSLIGYSDRLRRAVLPGVERFLADCRAKGLNANALCSADDAIADLVAVIEGIAQELRHLDAHGDQGDPVTAAAPATPITSVARMEYPYDAAIELAMRDGRNWDRLDERQRTSYRMAVQCIEHAFIKVRPEPIRGVQL